MHSTTLVTLRPERLASTTITRHSRLNRLNLSTTVGIRSPRTLVRPKLTNLIAHFSLSPALAKQHRAVTSLRRKASGRGLAGTSDELIKV
jgi:hypothetical protein